MKLTRRELVQATLAPVALAQLPGALTQLPGALTQLSSAQTVDALAAAKEQTRRNSESLAKIAVPMSTEPAFTFKAQ